MSSVSKILVKLHKIFLPKDKEIVSIKKYKSERNFNLIWKVGKIRSENLWLKSH